MTREELYSKNKSIGRLSEQEQACVKRILQKHLKRPGRVLVLGATPELRNPALDLGHKVLTQDISLDMINKRQHLLGKHEEGQEVIVQGNWLDPWYLQSDQFDAILADASFNNLAYDQTLALFNICKDLAKKNAILVFRHLSFHEKTSIEGLVALFRKKAIDEREFGLSLYAHRKLERNYEDLQVRVSDTLNAMVRVLRKHQLPKELIAFYEAHRWDGGWLILEQDHFRKLLKKHFGNYREHISRDIFNASFGPIYEVAINKQALTLPRSLHP